jgi:hypothetical protein
MSVRRGDPTILCDLMGSWTIELMELMDDRTFMLRGYGISCSFAHDSHCRQAFSNCA